MGRAAARQPLLRAPCRPPARHVRRRRAARGPTCTYDFQSRLSGALSAAFWVCLTQSTSAASSAARSQPTRAPPPPGAMLPRGWARLCSGPNKTEWCSLTVYALLCPSASSIV